MDLEVLKKRISSYRTPGGKLTKVPDELLVDILKAWEQWTGPSGGFYAALGVDYRKMASLIGIAKKLKRDGVFPEDAFKEIKVAESGNHLIPLTVGPCQGIEIIWDNGKLIRFPQVEVLIDFLKKVA